MRLGRSISAQAGGVAITVIGLLLGTSPWTEGLTRGGGSWSLATKTDFWSGLGLFVVGLATILLYRASLSHELQAAGITSRPARVDNDTPPAAPQPQAEPSSLSDEALLALATSVVNDLQRSGERQAAPRAAQPQTKAPSASVPSPSGGVADDELVRLASSLLSELQGASVKEKPVEEPTPPPPSNPPEKPAELMSESELARLASDLIREIQATKARGMDREGE